MEFTTLQVALATQFVTQAKARKVVLHVQVRHAVERVQANCHLSNPDAEELVKQVWGHMGTPTDAQPRKKAKAKAKAKKAAKKPAPKVTLGKKKK